MAEYPKREAGGDCIMTSLVISKLHQIRLGWPNQGWDGWTRKRWEMHTKRWM